MVNSNQAIVLFPHRSEHQSQVFHRSPPHFTGDQKDCSENSLDFEVLCVNETTNRRHTKVQNEQKYNEIQRSIFLSFTRVHIYMQCCIHVGCHVHKARQLEEKIGRANVRVRSGRKQIVAAQYSESWNRGWFTEQSSQSRVHRFTVKSSQCRVTE